MCRPVSIQAGGVPITFLFFGGHGHKKNFMAYVKIVKYTLCKPKKLTNNFIDRLLDF